MASGTATDVAAADLEGALAGELATTEAAEGGERMTGPSQIVTLRTPQGPDADGPDAGGFAPTRGGGLTQLASFEPTQDGATDPSAPGDGALTAETSGSPELAPLPTPTDDSGDGGFGFGLGGGGDGGGAGGGGAGGGGGLTGGSLTDANNPGPIAGDNPFTGLLPPVIGGDEKSCPPNCGLTASVLALPGLDLSSGSPATNSIIPLMEGDGGRNLDLPSAPVPEPASWAMLIMGFFGLGGALRRRRIQGRWPRA